LIVDGIWGTIKGLGTLVGFGGWDAMGQAWKGLAQLATGLAISSIPGVGTAFWALPEDKLPSWLRDSRTAMKETGKALVAWDEWGKNPGRAAGAVTFNVLTTVFTGGAGGAAAGAGKAGAVAKALSVAGKAGKVIDPMTYVAKGAGAGLTKIGDITKGLKGIGNVDIPKLPDGSVQLPDGRLLDPNGNLIGTNGAIETTPIPHETVPGTPGLPKSWTIDQPAMSGAHAGDTVPMGGHGDTPLGSTAHPPTGPAHMPAGPSGHVPGGTPAGHLPGDVGTHVPSQAGPHFPDGPHTPTHDAPGTHGHDGAGSGHHDAPGDGHPHGEGHADDATGHGDDAAHPGDHPDLGHDAADAAAHHGTDAPAAPGHGGTDVPGSGPGEPFEYKPHVSADDFDQLTDAEKHAVAQAELAQGTNPAPSVTDEAGLRYGNAYWDDFMDQVPASSKESLVTYTGSAYTQINGHLRFGHDVPDSITHTIDEMDKVMGARPVPENIMVVRGTEIGHLDLDSPLDMEGRVFDDKAYTSTALGKKPPPPFDQKSVYMHLRVPQGTPALWLEHITQVKGERELLLARGSEYKVTRVFMDEADGKWHVYGEVLPRP
ncbi:ADP-ribosyltransferase, partial [Streptomyces ochraceiscleroticus]